MNDERIYQAMTAEDKRDVIETFSKELASGMLQPKFAPHFLNLRQSQFSTRKFRDSPTKLINPPEFFFCAMPVLDAYATAFLSTDVDHNQFGGLRFACALKVLDGDTLKLLVSVNAEQGQIRATQWLDLQMLQRFPAALSAKAIDAGCIFLLEGEGYPMQIDYFGRMKVALSPFLRNREPDMWPEAYLNVSCTAETIVRARTVMKFIKGEKLPAGVPV